MADGLLNSYKQDWDVYYQKAILDDGTAFFPEKLSLEELDTIRRTQGSYMFANQYLNQIIPDENRVFKKHWLKYYSTIPERRDTVAFIDPNSMEDDKTKNQDHDYIGMCVVHGDEDMRWYVEWAQRMKVGPTAVINLIFDINARFKPRLIGVEDVFYNKMIIHLLWEEYKLRKAKDPSLTMPAVTPVKPPTDKSKERKIETALVPRMEWGRMFLNQGLHDLEHEMLTFPRSSTDDILDSLASCDSIISYPTKERNPDVKHHPTTTAYEKEYIKGLSRENR